MHYGQRHVVVGLHLADVFARVRGLDRADLEVGGLEGEALVAADLGGNIVGSEPKWMMGNSSTLTKKREKEKYSRCQNNV